MDDKFYKKEGLTIRKLINDLIEKSEGDRIDSITSYSQKYRVARGTVQNAFNFLKKENAIEVISKGHLGSYIVKIDKLKMIDIFGTTKYIGVMPLPYSLLYQGLATGIFLESQNNDIDIQMAFMRGAESRINMLLEGNYDFVVMSKLSSDYYINKYKNLEFILSFGEKTYVKEHLVILHKPYSNISDGMRFGVDFSSRDMVILTHHECKDRKVEFISLPYMQLVNKVISGEIDGAIVNADDILDKNIPINYRAIDESYFRGKDTEAVLLTRKDNMIMKEIWNSIIDMNNINKIQEDVFKGIQYPIY